MHALTGLCVVTWLIKVRHHKPVNACIGEENMPNNLQYQFKTAVDHGFKEGMDKHAIKAELGRKMADKVFSYKIRKALVQTGAQFANYIKRNYPQIKYIKDIQSEHVEAFLKDAICRGCSNITVQQYKTRLDKLALLAERKYHTPVRYMEHVKIKWKENIKTVRDKAFTRKDYNTVMEYTKDSRSYSRIGLELAGMTGARAEEITNIRAKDIKLDQKIIHIHNGKGKRSRDIPIQSKDMGRLSELIMALRPEEKLVPVRANSLNQYLARQCFRLGITEYKEAKTGIHAIRKMYATEAYLARLNSGMGKEEAWGEVSGILGHGKDRMDLFKVYVKV